MSKSKKRTALTEARTRRRPGRRAQWLVTPEPPGVKWNADRIKALRGHLQLTQTQMAQVLGTRQQTISEWEVGMYEPRGGMARLLTLVAERADFEYQAKRAGQDEK